jgi:hypothetical protein
LHADPTFRRAYYFAGQANIRWEHWSEATAELQAELVLVPDDADAKYNLGLCRVSRGLAVGDLFNDGNMDVVISDLDGAPMILRDRGVPGRIG